MADPVQDTDLARAFPSKADLPPGVARLLPTWGLPRTMSAVGNYDGYYLAVNEGYTEVLGWVPAELMSAPYWEFLHPEDRHPVVETGERLMQTGGVRTGVEVRMLCRDGAGLWTRWETVVDPTTELFYGVGVDISDEMPPVRRRVHVGTWTRDTVGGTLAWSEELYGMFGIPVGTTLTDELIKTHIHPQDHPLVDGAWRASIDDEDTHSADFRITRPDGTIRTLHSTGRVISRTDGRPMTIRGLTVDITDLASLRCDE